jgi:hypothetical protein
MMRGDAIVDVQHRRNMNGPPAAAAAATGAAAGKGARPLASGLTRLHLPNSSATVGSCTAGQAVVGLSTLDEANPQNFYLLDASLEELADCYAVVDGVRLPLLSQVLGAQCQVLRVNFISAKKGPIPAEVCAALCCSN